uniref:Uncharacterized protein n=1 Tax=Cacopsylla melanoneura TaxID=428564 RepID=A0A8D8R5B6_9HEMI
MFSVSKWMVLLIMCLPDTKAIINEEVKIIKYPDKTDQETREEKSEDDLDTVRRFSSPLDRCTYKVHHVLGSLSNRRSSNMDSAILDLSGYALHQTLRSAPYDMYITNMRIRLPYHKKGYIHVDKCRYDDLHKLLQTNMLFRDLTITGNIQLYTDQFGKKLFQQYTTDEEELYTQENGNRLRKMPQQNLERFNKRYQLVRSNRERIGQPLGRSQKERIAQIPEVAKGLLHRQTQTNPSTGDTKVREITVNDSLGKTLFDHITNYNLYYNANNNRYHNQLPRPVENCNMTLKLKSVGLGFSAIPENVVENDYSRNINIKTTATYLEPNYVSIHAYNCKNILANRGLAETHRSGDNYQKVDGIGEGEEDLESEMEQVFIKGSRSLLTNYMEKQFKNVLRDSLMTNLGYTVSYGRKR